DDDLFNLTGVRPSAHAGERQTKKEEGEENEEDDGEDVGDGVEHHTHYREDGGILPVKLEASIR
ncbi:unnamed protein product, partial [Amoebophrya sp. A25]